MSADARRRLVLAPSILLLGGLIIGLAHHLLVMSIRLRRASSSCWSPLERPPVGETDEVSRPTWARHRLDVNSSLMCVSSSGLGRGDPLGRACSTCHCAITLPQAPGPPGAAPSRPIPAGFRVEDLGAVRCRGRTSWTPRASASARGTAKSLSSSASREFGRCASRGGCGAGGRAARCRGGEDDEVDDHAGGPGERC